MIGCVCAQPLRSSNPRRAEACNRCGKIIDERPHTALSLRCIRCQHRFDPDKDGRAGIYIDRGGQGADRLKGQEVVHVCGACTETLRTWLRMDPRFVYRE